MHTYKIKFLSALIGVVSGVFAGQSLAAAAAKPAFDLGAAAKLTRVSIQGFSGDHTGGAGDVMLPLFWDGGRAFYFDLAAHYQGGTSNWLLGPGVGYRKVVRNDGIFGGYIFGDYNNYRDYGSVHFWVLNPGIEYINPRWDAHLNAYLPLSSKHILVGDDWADKFGITHFNHFEDHKMYSRKIKQYLDLGSGVDASFGFMVPKVPRLKLYAGGYYFKQHESDLNFENGPSNVRGGFLKLDFAATKKASVYLRDSYDNVAHNVVTVGIDITFGGSGKGVVNTDMQQHLLDPVMRDEAANSSGLSVPTTISRESYAKDTVKGDLELDNIDFFNNNHNGHFHAFDMGGNGMIDLDAADDGTYEHPYSANDFNQELVNSAASNTNFFFNSNGGSGLNIGSLILKDGQSIYGRNSDYTRAAEGDERFLFLGGMTLGGDNTLDSIRLQNDGDHNVGIETSTALNLVLNNVLIGDPNRVAARSYQYGVFMDADSRATISNSSIYAFSGTAASVRGIDVRGGDLILRNSTVDAQASANNSTAVGIAAENYKGDDGSTVEIYNSTIRASNTNALESTSNRAFGLSIMGDDFDDVVKIYDSNISATSTAGVATGAWVRGSNSQLYLVRDTVNANAHLTAEAAACWEADIHLQSTVLNAISTNGAAYAVDARWWAGEIVSHVYLDDNNNTFKAHGSAPAGPSYGIYAHKGSEQVIGSYQNNTYDVLGGTGSADWHFGQ